MIIRYGPVVKECLKQITDWLLYDLQTPNEKKLIREFYDRIQVTNATNQKLLQELVITVQKEYTEKHISIDISLNKTIDSETRIRQSAELAKSMGVAEDKIMKSEKDYESFFS
jgi:GH35 family endo-1,4-beta-xylanase